MWPWPARPLSQAPLIQSSGDDRLTLIMFTQRQKPRDVTNPQFEICDENARKAIACLIGLTLGFLLTLIVMFFIIIHDARRIDRLELQLQKETRQK